MRVLVIGNVLNTPAVACAADEEGVELCCITLAQAVKLTDSMPQEQFEAILAGSDHGGHASLEGNPLLERNAVLVPMSGENLAAGVGNVPARDAEQMGVYFAYGGNVNLRHGFRLLRRLAGEDVGEIPEPAPLPPFMPYTSVMVWSFTAEGIGALLLTRSFMYTLPSVTGVSGSSMQSSNMKDLWFSGVICTYFILPSIHSVRFSQSLFAE